MSPSRAPFSLARPWPCSCLHSSLKSTSSTRRLLRARPSSSSSRHPDATAKPTRPTASTAELLGSTRDLLRSYPLLEETTWAARLDMAKADLLHHRRARIAVMGDRESGTSALVTASFDDPLASDGDVSVALASRRLGDPPEAIALSYAESTTASTHELAIPSAWLRDHTVDVVEVLHGAAPPLQSSLDVLHTADTAVLLVSEVRGLSAPNTRAILLELAGKPNIVLVVDMHDPTHLSAARTLELQLEALLPVGQRPPVVTVSTAQALEGLEALAPEDTTTPVSFEKFQREFVASGLAALKERLAASVASLHASSSEPGVSSLLQQQTASYVVDKALHAAAFAGAQIEDTLRQASTDVAALAFVSDEAERKVLADLGVVDGALEVPVEDLQAARAELEALLDGRLAWWKLPARTDDIASELAAAVEHSYLRQFEDQLIFATGRLLALSSTMSARTDALLATRAFAPRTSPLSSLYSPVLLNRLAQAKITSSQISPVALSAPLVARRNQISAPGGPAEVLQARAQKAVVSAASLSGGSVAAAIAAQVMEYADLATNAAAGLLGTVLAAWLLQRGWDKARNKFFVDVEQRVTGGLEDDLGAAAQRLVDRSLFMSRTAVAASEEMLRQRRQAFDAFAASLARIDERRRVVREAQSPRAGGP